MQVEGAVEGEVGAAGGSLRDRQPQVAQHGCQMAIAGYLDHMCLAAQLYPLGIGLDEKGGRGWKLVVTRRVIYDVTIVGWSARYL